MNEYSICVNGGTRSVQHSVMGNIGLQ